MDTKRFDDVARSLSEEHPSRRQALRALAGVLLGGALGGVGTRLGLVDVTEAKPKTRKAKPNPKTKAKPRRKPQARRRSGGPVWAERKGKGKKKSKKKPPPLPPGCQNCNECQMCKNGACAPDPALERVRCQGSGAACGYCQDGVCAASEERPCQDGVCPRKGQCCPEEGAKQCIDPELPRGFYCVDSNVCCPDTERRCASGSCLPRAACCPEQRRCNPLLCVGQNECCPDETPCANGSCAPAGQCCDGKPRCGDVCCEADETCLEDPGGPPWIWRCCPNELNVNGHCCDGNKTVCGPAPGRPAYEKYCCAEGSVCCGEGKSCCPEADGYCCASSGTCLPKNLGPWMECGKGCGRIEYDQCCAGYACSKTAVCSDNRCCPRGYHRCGDSCCRD